MELQDEKNLLTAREIEVLNLVCKGYTNPEIARILIISNHTAKAHVASILRKFEVQNRALAICHAIKHGLIDFEIDKKEDVEQENCETETK